MQKMPDEQINPEEYYAWDTLLTNGMLDRYETYIVAITHDELQQQRILAKNREDHPEQEYVIKGDYIYSVHYFAASGSNADTADRPGEIELHNRNLLDAIEHDRAQALCEAFPEEY